MNSGKVLLLNWILGATLIEDLWRLSVLMI
jgi:hypothetical protein